VLARIGNMLGLIKVSSSHERCLRMVSTDLNSRDGFILVLTSWGQRIHSDNFTEEEGSRKRCGRDR